MYEPLGAWYHATKFAVEGLSDSLRLELKPHGIDVAIIEPAGTQSEWGAIAAQGLLASSGNGPYAAQAKVVAAALGTTDNPATSSRPGARGRGDPARRDRPAAQDPLPGGCQRPGDPAAAPPAAGPGVRRRPLEHLQAVPA